MNGIARLKVVLILKEEDIGGTLRKVFDWNISLEIDGKGPGLEWSYQLRNFRTESREPGKRITVSPGLKVS